tara:strand:+ start:503 stop:991 length:489 start_codon:yes stop_codon:yes gene_type:complete
MGVRNYLIEGVSGTGKTSVCDELQRRGHHAIHGDRELAYQGDPQTGEPLKALGHATHIWHIGKVETLVADQTHAMTFFCGGSRNFPHFIHLFDAVFVLDVDISTLNERLASRPEGEWGNRASERAFIAHLHETKEDVPASGIIINATARLPHVVDEILSRCK